MKSLTQSSSYRYGNLAQPQDVMSPFVCRSVGQRKVDHYRSQFTAHDFYELIWTIKGEAVLELENGEKYILQAGHVFIVPPEAKRVVYTTGQGSWHCRWISAIGPLFEELAKGYGMNLMTSIPCGSLEYYFTKLESILGTYSPKVIKDADVVVYDMLNRISRGIDFKKENLLAERGIALIEENISEPKLNIDWLAEQLKVNRSHLSRVFKSETGEPPSGYIMRRRLHLAMNYLQHGNLKISQVAVNCGFTDTDYFSRFFQKASWHPTQRIPEKRADISVQ